MTTIIARTIVRAMILFFLCITTATSQNLVPNPGFEFYTQCPWITGQLVFASPWTYPSYNPNISGTYFNACSEGVGVPLNTSGYSYQEAHGGDGYIGCHFSGTHNYSQVNLVTALETDQCYYVEFFVSCHDRSSFGCNNIAALLSDTAVQAQGEEFQPNFSLILATPQIMLSDNPVITDTLNWVRIAGVYQAQGGEQFLTIGNFSSDANTDTIHIQDDGYGAADYYIDDVTVTLASNVSLPAYAGVDTIIQQGDTVHIGNSIGGLQCQWWANGVLIPDAWPSIRVAPQTTMEYVVRQDVCGVISWDTVVVTVLPTGVTDPSAKNDFAVSPNPTNGEVNIVLPVRDQGEWSLMITNAVGQVMHKSVQRGNVGSIRTSIKGASGMHLVQATNTVTGEAYNTKVILE